MSTGSVPELLDSVIIEEQPSPSPARDIRGASQARPLVHENAGLAVLCAVADRIESIRRIRS